MHKPPRRMHNFDGAVAFCPQVPQGAPCKFRNIQHPGAHERENGRTKPHRVPRFRAPTPQRPLIFNGMRPTSSAFRPKPSMQAPADAEYSQKCTPHSTPGKQQLNLFRPIITRRGNTEPVGQRAGSIPAHSAGRKKPSPHEVRSEGFLHVRGRAGMEPALCPDVLVRVARQLTRRCKPSYAGPRQHQTECRSGSREASSSRGRSRCSRPGRSRSHRHHRPCCQSRPPGR